jgi:hypothetical protein
MGSAGFAACPNAREFANKSVIANAATTSPAPKNLLINFFPALGCFEEKHCTAYVLRMLGENELQKYLVNESRRSTVGCTREDRC